MLTRIEILIWILGNWLLFGVIYVIVKKKRGNKIPVGSLLSENASGMSSSNLTPQQKRARGMVLLGMGIGELILVLCVVAAIFNIWDNIAFYLAIELPELYKILGIMLFWIHSLWGVWVLSFNVNYTPLNKSIVGRYVCATQGPYKLTRHPMYLIKGILPLIIFLMMGIWISLLGLMAWIGLPQQMKNEEDFLSATFGQAYDEYMQHTPRFIF